MGVIQQKFGVGMISAALLGLGAIPSQQAQAHARFKLDSITKPRSNSPGLKTAECGGIPRTAIAAEFAPGQTITVEWEETVNHPGYYRIAFAPADDQNFDQNVLKDNIQDALNAEALPHFYKADITLPMQTCAACTLQLIQYMTESMPPSKYYSCSDIKLVAGSTGGGSGGGGGNSGTPSTPKEIAQGLLDDIATSDADSDGRLSYAETQTSIPGLSVAQFNSFDSNGDGLLTQAELTAAITGLPTTPPTSSPKDEAAAGGILDWLSLLTAVSLLLRRRK